MLVPQVQGLIDPPSVLPDPAHISRATEEQWLQAMEQALQSDEQLNQAKIPRRENVMGSWFRQGDLGFIFGPRGLGKTWFALHLSRKIGEGGSVASWQAPRPRRVLYIDGEMPLDGLRERNIALTGAETGGGMVYLHHESLFDRCGGVLNLAHPMQQAALSALCVKQNFEVLVLDNLSCLFSGLKENDADGWDRVLPWLLDLRRNRIAVVFVAHAGRNGFMRGTSRREDAAFWILQLTAPQKSQDDLEDGAHFLCRFDKNRNATEDECPPIEFTFRRGAEGGPAEVAWKHISQLEKLRYWVRQGITSATNIAREMDVSTSRVSYLASMAMKQGWLRKGKNREYILVEGAQPGGSLSAADADEVLSTFPPESD